MSHRQKLINKYLFLFGMGGILYVFIELLWRSWSHWTMFALGGLCFIYLGLINEVLRWDTPLWQQVLIGAIGITALEFVTGCVVNLRLGWGVWDYNGLPISLAGIILDDWIRYRAFGEERPRYNIGVTRYSKRIVWMPE